MSNEKKELKNPITNKDALKIINDVMRRSQFAKQEMCKSQGITDNPAMLLIAWESDEDDDEHESAVEYAERVGLTQPFTVGMVPLIHKSDVLDAYMEVVKNMPIQKFGYLFMVVEGYLDPRHFENGTTPDDYKTGDMADDFQNNPFTEIKEALCVHGLNWDASETYVSFSPYKYDDKGVPQFEKVVQTQRNLTKEEADEQPLGRMLDAMVATVRYMALAVKAKDFHSLITKPDPNGDSLE